MDYLKQQEGWTQNGIGVVIANVAVGVWLMIRLVTDYSLVGTWSDIVVDAACGIVVLMMLQPGIRQARTERARRLVRVSSVPGIVLGCLPLLLDLLLFLTPFSLGTMFYWSEIRAEQIIQQTTAPDDDWTVQVWFRPVGPYAAGSGRTFVKVVPRWVPFIEWDLYYNRRSYADTYTSDYAQWLDSERLYIPEAEQVFRLTWWGIETEEAP